MSCEHCTPDPETGDCEYIGDWKTGFYIEDGKLKANGSWNEAKIEFCPICGKMIEDDD